MYGTEWTRNANSIRMIFSISDLDAEAPEADEYVEGAEQDTAAAADAGSGGVGEESAVGGPSEDSFPVEASITVTKAGQQGALTIDAVAQGACAAMCRTDECYLIPSRLDQTACSQSATSRTTTTPSSPLACRARTTGRGKECTWGRR